MTIEIDYSKGQKQILIDLIRKDNYEEPLLEEWVIFGTPKVFEPTEDIPRNTKILISNTRISDYIGQRDYFYNRLNITDFLYDGIVMDSDLTFTITDETTSRDLAEAVSTALKILITEDMIINETLPLISFGVVTEYHLQLSDDNLIVNGVLPIYLTR